MSERLKKPDWIRVKIGMTKEYRFVEEVLARKKLNTVCEEAACPNIGECWAHGTATFMLMGDTCTRGCTFCSVGRGRPLALEESEPEHVAEVIEALRLDYAVLTSVTRSRPGDVPHGDDFDFDLIVTDLRMPNLNGQQLYERTAEERPDLLRRFLAGDVKTRHAVREGSDQLDQER